MKPSLTPGVCTSDPASPECHPQATNAQRGRESPAMIFELYVSSENVKKERSDTT